MQKATMTRNIELTLRNVPIGRRARIHQLQAEPEVSLRLRELGFCEDTVVRCVMRSHGKIICEIYNSRIGLDGVLAGNIVVTLSE
jgi:Fe2+ transport system protein FeoA